MKFVGSVELGRRVRMLRLCSGMSQLQLASRLGYSRSRLAKQEGGTVFFSLNDLCKIANHFSVSIDDLVFADSGKFMLVVGRAKCNDAERFVT